MDNLVTQLKMLILTLISGLIGISLLFWFASLIFLLCKERIYAKVVFEYALYLTFLCLSILAISKLLGLI
jgi:hypothetical protein